MLGALGTMDPQNIPKTFRRAGSIDSLGETVQYPHAGTSSLHFPAANSYADLQDGVDPARYGSSSFSVRRAQRLDFSSPPPSPPTGGMKHQVVVSQCLGSSAWLVRVPENQFLGAKLVWRNVGAIGA